MSYETELAALNVAVQDLTAITTTLDATTNSGYNAAVVAATDQVSLATAQANTATAQAVIATAQAVISTAQNAASGASASAASSSASQAATARDLSIAAWAASTVPNETVAAISQSIHIGAVVKAIVYDTSKDSDGGAWRKRCSDKSWYTETLGGSRWIGQAATISAAWTAAGSATGAVFQASATAGPITSGKYYSADSNTTATEVFRGISREFPAVVGIVAEITRVVIYDLSQAAAPMWMVFTSGNSQLLYNGSTLTCLAAVGGLLVIGHSATVGAALVSFPSDKKWGIRSDTYRYSPGSISNRNAVDSAIAGFYSAAQLVNNTVNDVAITVLDTTPIDPATGLPTPTIAVATAGGVSVISDSGTVRNSLSTTASYGISFDDLKRVVWNTTTEINRSPVPPLAASFTASVAAQDIKLSSSEYSTSNVSIMPAVTTDTGKTARNAVASSAGLTVYKAGQTAPSVMLAAITATTATASGYNTGWMPGDIRLATLADSTAETVTASGELVTNGTFDTDTSGWTAKNATLAVVSNELEATATSTATIGAYQQIVTVVNKTYTATASARAPSTNTGSNVARLRIYESTSRTVDLGSSYVSAEDATRALSVTFVATTTTTVIDLDIASSTAWGSSGDKAYFDNISVKLATPDRSVKNKGLVINGSLTKTAVASGASLVAYSGFSAANYLEQPYNSDLDFTADFSICGWFTTTSIAANTYLLQRAVTAGGIILFLGTDGALAVYGTATAGFTSLVATAASAVAINTLYFVSIVRASGTIKIYLNAVEKASAASSGDLTYANAILRIGVGVSGDFPASAASLALWRISATAPSADQIAHIYRTELPLFQTNAKCLIDGTSTAVTALAYDDTTDLLHVGTSYGRSTFKDLLRVDTDVTSTGALTSLSASQGVIITGGTSGKVYVPAMLLRDELRRKDEAKKALGRVVVFQEFDAATSQVAFVVAKGYTVKAVYSAGTLKRVGSTKDYVVSDDGFQETITFAVAPGNTVWVSALTVRK